MQAVFACSHSLVSQYIICEQVNIYFMEELDVAQKQITKIRTYF